MNDDIDMNDALHRMLWSPSECERRYWSERAGKLLALRTLTRINAALDEVLPRQR